MIPINSFDVIVAGGGPAGICAAIASARMGRRTALLEKHPLLGGMGTAALVNNFCNAHHDGQRFIIGGIFSEIRNALIQRNALFASGGGLEPYDHIVFAEIVDALCREAGVTLFTGLTPDSIAFPSSGQVTVKWRETELRGRVLVDATGDASAAHAAGASFWPRPDDEPPMPLTYCYLFGPVDLAALEKEMPDALIPDQFSKQRYVYLGPQEKLKPLIKQARQTGELTIPRERIAVAYSIPGSPEILSVNFGRVTVQDPTDAKQLAAAEEIGRRQVAEGAAFLQKYVPGCENGRVLELARQIGIRESRQIRGRYRLTSEDVLGCRQFEDTIAQCCYAVDIHDPKSDKTTMISLPRGQHYDIPLRCLLPVDGPSNLIVAGRSISATQEAMSSFRVSPSVMAIGQSAGVTAALAASTHASVSLVPVGEVQRELVEQGAILK